MDDPRWAYNAWTYLIGVPTVLIFASMLARTVVTEQVERSIQLGFLLSVVVHLLLMVVAVNVVLFSGMWPDALRDMERLVRENSRATQFVELQPSEETLRPDYLAPVPAELAQPTNTDSSPLPSMDSPLETIRNSMEPSVSSQADLNPTKTPQSATQPEIVSETQPLTPPERSRFQKEPQQVIDIPKITTSSTNEPEAESYAMLSDRASKQTTLQNRSQADAPPTSISSRNWEPEVDLNKSMRRSESQAVARVSPVRPDGQLPDLDRFAQSQSMETSSTRIPRAPGSTSRTIQVPPVRAVDAQSDNNSAAAAKNEGVSSQLLDRTQITSRSRGESPRLSDSEPSTLRGNSSTAEPSVTALAGGRVNSSSGAMANSDIRINSDLQLNEPSVPRLDTSRFRRREIGGGVPKTQVSVPAPAFKQRMRRNESALNQELQAMGPLGPQTEEAIERGLEFLARYQREDGSWRLEDFGEAPRLRSDTAATALALLSFQGAGYSHEQFKYQQTCRKAITWLQSQQQPNGDLYRRMDEASDKNAWLYSHAIASLALCEAYGMTQDESIRDAAQRSVNFLIESQDPNAGGWRYAPRIGSDTSVTGWAMMALKSAELAGLQVPGKVYEGINRWLSGAEASVRERHLYRYNWQANTPETMHGRIPTPVMTSVGLLMRFYLGWRRTTPDMQRGSDWLLEQPPDLGTIESPQRDTYYWYYASQVMFHMGGTRWRQWYSTLYPILIQSQEVEGPYTGSWDPAGPIPDAWGPYAGRLYVTTMNLLSLEVTYRHLPIYEATAQ
jgi:hypothetical protein